MQITLTDASNADILQLFSEYDDCIIDFLGEDSGYYTRYQPNERIEAVWLASCSGMPAGCAGFRLKSPGIGEVKRVFLRPEYRGKGLSKRLLSTVEDYARAQRCHTLYLDTRSTLEPAVSLYRSFGFQETYRAGLYIQMEKSLAQPVIRRACPADYQTVRAFYDELIDQMQMAEHRPAWEKGVYPAYEYLRQSLELGHLWLCECDGRPAAAMILNHECNEGYGGVHWAVEAAKDQVSVIHALGVTPAFQGKGLAGMMVQKAVEIAKSTGQRAIRLDVLEGNLPAERLYEKHGFRCIDTVSMFYEDTGWTNFKLYEYALEEKE